MATLFALTALATTTPAKADTVGVTSLSALGATDTVDWSQFYTPASPFAALSNPQPFVSTGGATGSLSSTGDMQALQQGTTAAGNFASGTAIIYASSANAALGNDLTVTFKSPVSAVGGQIQSGNYGFFSATISAYDLSHTLLGSFTENGHSTDPSGSFNGNFNPADNKNVPAILIGLISLNAFPDISSIMLSVTGANGADAGGLAFGPLEFNGAGSASASATPLPGSVWMMGTVLGCAAAGYAFSQRKKSQSERQLSEPNLALSAA